MFLIAVLLVSAVVLNWFLAYVGGLLTPGWGLYVAGLAGLYDRFRRGSHVGQPESDGSTPSRVRCRQPTG